MFCSRVIPKMMATDQSCIQGVSIHKPKQFPKHLARRTLPPTMEVQDCLGLRRESGYEYGAQ